MPRIDKLIITHRGALRAKYGGDVSRIDEAVQALVKADAERAIVTRVVSLDDAAALGRHGAAVAGPDDPRGVKDAVDRLAHALRPDYVLLLGARDVVPHQSLRNTKRDDDPDIPSDLPYACEDPWSRDPRRYIAPMRVVGRLPDLTGAHDPSYLVRLLRTAARWRMRPRAYYEHFFALSALAWKESTNLSLRNLFGTSGDMRTSPKEGPRWPRSLLARRIHFVNCHGAAADPYFYGENPNTGSQPRAHSAAHLERRDFVAEGAVVAAECCYGADLYDPRESAGQKGICHVYLAQGCYGFFGSTCTAYGPAEGNGQADLLCQYFLERVLRGASLGRAALEARLRFVQAAAPLQPEDVKTLAQFVLLGDPSAQPVARAPDALADSSAAHVALAGAKGRHVQRLDRRVWMLRSSRMVSENVGTASLPRPFRGGKKVRTVLLKVAREAGVRQPVLSSHPVRDPVGARLWRAAGGRVGTVTVHIATGRPRRTRKSTSEPGPVSVVATVQDGQIVRLRRLHAR